MLIQQSKHAISMIDNISYSIVGGPSDSFVRSDADVVPLLHQIINDFLAGSWRPIMEINKYSIYSNMLMRFLHKSAL